jgi:hypothetical protein
MWNPRLKTTFGAKRRSAYKSKRRRNPRRRPRESWAMVNESKEAWIEE